MCGGQREEVGKQDEQRSRGPHRAIRPDKKIYYDNEVVIEDKRQHRAMSLPLLSGCDAGLSSLQGVPGGSRSALQRPTTAAQPQPISLVFQTSPNVHATTIRNRQMPSNGY